MSTAVKRFLRQTLRERAIPFGISPRPVGKRAAPHGTPRMGGWEKKLRIADDFDAPLDGFKEHL
jgi:hypothetical protein